MSNPLYENEYCSHLSEAFAYGVMKRRLVPYGVRYLCQIREGNV